jgi:RNA polymerase primary sigma factor
MNKFIELNDINTLSDEEISVLVAKISQGSKVALDKLILHNIKLVCHMAKKRMYKNYNLDYDELVSYGIQSLRRAAEKFDCDKGVKFSTYSARWINSGFQKYIESLPVIRVPHTTKAHIRRFKAFREDFISQYNHEPSLEDVAKEMGVLRSTARLILRHYDSKMVYLDSNNLTSKDHQLNHELIEDVNVSVFEPTAVYNKEDKNELNKAVLSDCLTDIERLVIKFRFGLFGHEQKTLEGVSQIINKTRERVRQIETDAIKKLKTELANKGVTL